MALAQCTSYSCSLPSTRCLSFYPIYITIMVHPHHLVHISQLFCSCHVYILRTVGRILQVPSALVNWSHTAALTHYSCEAQGCSVKGADVLQRHKLARLGCAGCQHIKLHKGGPYLGSPSPALISSCSLLLIAAGLSPCTDTAFSTPKSEGQGTMQRSEACWHCCHTLLHSTGKACTSYAGARHPACKHAHRIAQ